MNTTLTQYLGNDDAIARDRLTGAAGLLARWRQADERINDYIAVGNYRAATQVALGTAADDSTPAFDRLNDALSGAIEESRRQLRGDILSALRVLSGTTVGGALLAVGAALVAAGIGASRRR